MRRATRSFCLPTMLLVAPGRAGAAETEVQYRFQDYDEENDRIHVEASYFRFDHLTDSGFSLGVQYAHDSLSGATPVGTYDPDDPNRWDYQYIEDVRNALVIEAGQDFGEWSLALEYARSEESDYLSESLALRGAFGFCDKNTVLTAGLSYSDDTILANPGTTILNNREKSSFELSLGLTQILDRNTFLNLNLGYGESSGYLSDPYRRISETDSFTIAGFTFVDTISHPENRPDWQRRAVARIGLTHYVEPLDAALEGSYRFYSTSDSLEAHTFELRWTQQLTEHFSVSPFFRYYRQSGADYYYPSLTGTPIDGHGQNDGRPPNYSSDYRVAALDSLSYGIQFRFEPTDALAFDLQLERYEMSGRDPRTPAGFFPSANIISLGASWSF